MMEEIKTPNLDKIKSLQDQTQLCGEFLEWLQNKYAMFERNITREDPFYVGTGDYINVEKVLAEFFEINLAEAEKEKEFLLEMIRKEKK